MRTLRIVPLVLLLAACGGGGSETSTADVVTDSDGGMDLAATSAQGEAVVAMEPPPAEGMAQSAAERAGGTGSDVPPLASAPALDPMLIRTGSATIRVDTLERGIAAVRALAERSGGIVGAVSMSGGERQARHATLELRIPSERFDGALVGLAPIGRVEAVDVTVEDVGEQFADVEARVANATRLESRLLDLLERRTGRLEEMLQLEREVARVREEIERYEGRLRFLRTRASVSLLTVTVREPEALIGPRPGEQPIRDAFRTAWENFVGLLAGLIAASGLLIPFGAIAFVLWRVFRAVRRRDAEQNAAYRERLRREREAAAAEAEQPGAEV